MDEREAYYCRFHAKLDTEAIPGILNGPAIMDSHAQPPSRFGRARYDG